MVVCDGAEWCKVEKDGARWCRVVHGAIVV